MTFNIGYIEGGTGAGKKRGMLAANPDWECKCPATKRGFMVNCKTCGARRP